MHTHERRPPTRKLLVLPGWDDHGREQYDALSAKLLSLGWACARANLPDAHWDPGLRARVTPARALQLACNDFDVLAPPAARQEEAGVVAVLGFSFGAYIAAHLTGLRNIGLLILRSPAIYPDEAWLQAKESIDDKRLLRFRRRVHLPSENRALAICAMFRGHVLLISSENDEVIPRPVVQSYGRAFTKAASLQTVDLKSADHELGDPLARKTYQAQVVRWLAEMTS
jgi:pimeloyl-ACP methyl ester carboxylesterase